MGTGTVQRIDTEAFESALSAMDCAVRCFQGARRNIINATDPVMDDWDGQGADAFRGVYKKLKTELEDEEINLTTIRDDLKGIKESYEGWDSDLASQMAAQN